jgi:D-glycero-D-manno-heptose 1,7-bisphosphate phosphatase
MVTKKTPHNSGMKRAVFLDRDGVINQKAPEGLYITRWEDFRILPGVVEFVAQLNRAGLSAIVVTNQRCVAKGLMTIPELEDLHRRMSDSFAKSGATIDAVYYCPHEMQPTCRCRKPAPGMLLDAASEHGIELAESWMIGDSDIDVEAGKNAGCKTILLLEKNELSGERRGRTSDTNAPDIVAHSLPEVIRSILGEKSNNARSLIVGPAVT